MKNQEKIMETPTPKTDKAYFCPGATMYSLAGEMKILERENTQLKSQINIEKENDMSAKPKKQKVNMSYGSGIVFVIARDLKQYEYLKTWCVEEGKGMPYGRGERTPPIPIGIDINQERSGWTDEFDRNAEYMEFPEFIKLTAKGK